MNCKDCKHFTIDKVEFIDTNRQSIKCDMYVCNYGNKLEWKVSAEACEHFDKETTKGDNLRKMEGQQKPLSEEERLEGMAWMAHETNERTASAICKEFGRDFANNLIEQGLYEEGLTLMKSLAGESE